MKVYIPMKLRADYVLQQVNFHESEGLHYSDFEDAQEALSRIPAPPAPIDAPKFGPNRSYQLNAPAVSFLLTLEMPESQWMAGYKNPLHHPPGTPPETFFAKIHHEQIQSIMAYVEGDLCAYHGHGCRLQKEADFPMDTLHTMVQNCLDSRMLYAEALKRTPDALLRELPKIPRIPQELHGPAHNLYTMFSSDAMSHTKHPSTLLHAVVGKFLNEMSSVCTTDAAMHIDALFREIKNDQPLPVSIEGMTQLLEHAIQQYAEDCCPMDYTAAMTLRQNAREYVQEALQEYKALGPHAYQEAFFSRIPVNIAQSIRLSHHMMMLRQDPNDPGRNGQAMAEVLKTAVKVFGTPECEVLAKEALNDAAQARNATLGKGDHEGLDETENDTPEEL